MKFFSVAFAALFAAIAVAGPVELEKRCAACMFFRGFAHNPNSPPQKDKTCSNLHYEEVANIVYLDSG